MGLFSGLTRKHDNTRVNFCEFKAPGGSNTQWTLNSYDKVNPTSLSNNNLIICFTLVRKCDIKATFCQSLIDR